MAKRTSTRVTRDSRQEAVLNEGAKGIVSRFTYKKQFYESAKGIVTRFSHKKQF